MLDDLNAAESCTGDCNSPFVVFDTEAAPERERFGLWRDHVAGVLASFDFDPIGDRPFYARMETLSIKSLKINRGDSTTGSWVRRPNHLSDGREHLALYLGGCGSFRVVQGKHDAVCERNSFALVDDSKASEFFLESSDGDYGLVLPYEILERLKSRRVDFALPLTGAPSSGLMLLRTYIDSLYLSWSALADPQVVDMVYDHVIDLIICGLNPSHELAHPSQNRGLKAARVRAVLDAINKNFSSPDVNSKSIAAQLNISQRYLHELLEERGLNFTHLVLEKRLDMALSMLRNPAHDCMRIGQIAYQCGFNDLSYFNRRFRARFGETPGGIRSRHG